MRTDNDIERTMVLHGDTVWRVCLLRMGSRADAQDMLQETFLTYATHDNKEFENEEHRKAWLIRVATNRCTDLLRSRSHRYGESPIPLEESPSLELSEQPDAVLWEVADALEQLPGDQREALFLTACEGYTAVEAAQLMDVPVNTLYTWVARGKKRLKEVLS